MHSLKLANVLVTPQPLKMVPVPRAFERGSLAVHELQLCAYSGLFIFSWQPSESESFLFSPSKPDITIAFPSLSANDNALNRTEVFTFTRQCFSPDFKICNLTFEKEQVFFF